ncbi:coiled-coil domain-containing protein 177 isoform X1 [Anabrus simplex]
MTPSENAVMKENAPPRDESARNIKNLDSSSYKLLSIENGSRTTRKKTSRKQTVIRRECAGRLSNPNSCDVFLSDCKSPPPSPQQWYGVLHLTGGSGGEESYPASSDSRKNQPSSLPSKPPPATRTKHYSTRTCAYNKRFLNGKNFPVASAVSTFHCSSSSSGSSIISSSTAIASSTTIELRGGERYSKFNKTPSQIKSRLCTANRVKEKSRVSVNALSDCQRKRNVLHDVKLTNCDSNNNSSRESKFSQGSNFFKRKQVSLSYLSSDDLCLSEHDRRILGSMALKKELERECDEFAHQAHKLWEKDRVEREQLNHEHAVLWQEYVAEKRRLENAENARRWEEMKHSLRKSQLLLERNILKKEEQTAKLKMALEEKKLIEATERSLLAAQHRAEVEAVQQKLEQETALWQQNLDQQQKERLKKAENIRTQHRETYRRRVASANRVEELRHQERWQQVKEETRAALQTLRQLCRVREQRAKERYQQLLEDRDRHLKKLSLERAIKFQQVCELHDELDHGLRKWQEQVLTLQREATERAEYNAIRQIENKRQRIEAENRARSEHHNQLMERISREEEARERYMRELISRKEAKMKRMAYERDLAIRESRLQAQTTADLREHLRRTLSPETFDRKVARVALEMRVAGRTPTASPTMTRSHIFLG